jgi:hypothetical protein
VAVSRSISVDHGSAGEIEIYDEGLQLKRRPWGFFLLVHGGVRLSDGFGLLLIEGNCTISRVGEGGGHAGVVLTDPRPYVLQGGAAELKLRVDLDERTLHEFEIKRVDSGGGDVNIGFALAPLLLQQGPARRGYCSIDCRLPTSRWADLLTQAGFALALLHRFPPASLAQRDGDRYRTVVESFQRAERHLIEGRPTNAVEECRNVLNVLARVACGGKEFEENAMRELLRPVLDGDKRERVLRLWKGLLSVANDPHHPRVEGGSAQRVEYHSDEARYVLSVTAATLEFIGLLLGRRS